MGYDLRSQIKPPAPCTAGANSGLPGVKAGIAAFEALGVAPTSMVLGLPWYGFDYKCLNPQHDSGRKISTGKPSPCNIPHVPFRGVNCSDAAGQVVTPEDAETLLQFYNASVHWDESEATPYFEYTATNGDRHQVWFDNAHSLRQKAEFAKRQGLRYVASVSLVFFVCLSRRIFGAHHLARLFCSWEKSSGIGCWEADLLDYTNHRQVKNYWNSFLPFLED
jgi:Di-N-acetylchitobiase